MNFTSLPTCLDYIDSHFRIDMTQDYIHDHVKGWFKDKPMTVTRTTRRSNSRHFPLYTSFGVLLEGLVVHRHDLETKEQEAALNQWFEKYRAAVMTEQNKRREELTKFFKRG